MRVMEEHGAFSASGRERDATWRFSGRGRHSEVSFTQLAARGCLQDRLGAVEER